MSWADIELERLKRVRRLYDNVKRSIETELKEWRGDNQPDPPADAEKSYSAARVEWRGEDDAIRKVIRSVWGEDEDAPWGSYQAVERCFGYDTLKKTVDSLVSYGQTVDTVPRHTFDPAESFFIRMGAVLRERKTAEPSDLSRILGSPARAADWLEVHPQTMRAVVVILLIVLAIQFPEILGRGAEIVRAFQGR